MSQTGQEKLAAARAVISDASRNRMTSGYGPPPPRRPSANLTRTNALKDYAIPFSSPPVNAPRPPPPVNTPRANTSRANTSVNSPKNTSRKNCRQFNPRRSGSPVYRKTGKPTFNTTQVCGPKPCPISGQTRNASGNCMCPRGEEEVGGKCVAFCPSDRKRVGLDCVCNEGFLPGKDGKCYKKVECVSPETPNLDFTFCECKAPYTKNPSTGKCEGVTKCVYPMTLNTTTNTCECKGPGVVEINGKCEVVTKCGPDETLIAGTNKCDCKSGFTRDALGKCCDLSKNEMINGECVPKCNANEDRVGRVCVPKLDPTKDLTIETGVEMGGFKQVAIRSKTGAQYNNIERVKITINSSKHTVTFTNTTSGDTYSLVGIPYKYTYQGISGPLTAIINGVVHTDNRSTKGGTNDWFLIIKDVKIQQMKIGRNTQSNNGVAIVFGPDRKQTPPPVFIITDGLTSYVQDGKTITTKPEVMAEILKAALLPPVAKGGRRKTLKRKYKGSKKTKKLRRK